MKIDTAHPAINYRIVASTIARRRSKPLRHSRLTAESTSAVPLRSDLVRTDYAMSTFSNLKGRTAAEYRDECGEALDRRLIRIPHYQVILWVPESRSSSNTNARRLPQVAGLPSEFPYSGTDALTWSQHDGTGVIGMSGEDYHQQKTANSF